MPRTLSRRQIALAKPGQYLAAVNNILLAEILNGALVHAALVGGEGPCP
jgi:hypothetical protein